MEKFNTLISNIFNAISQFFLALIMFLVVCNVAMRFLGKPLTGTVEFVGYLAAMVASLALGYCAIQGGHIVIDFFVEKLHLKLKRILRIITSLLISFFLLLVFYRIALYANQLRLGGEVSLTTGIPYYPVGYFVVLGFFVYFLVSLGTLLKSFKKVGQR